MGIKESELQEMEYCRNPFSKNKTWLYRDQLLKRTKSKSNLPEGVPILKPIKTLEQDGFVYELFDYLPKNVCKADYTNLAKAINLAGHMANMSGKGLKDDSLKVWTNRIKGKVQGAGTAVKYLNDSLFPFLPYMEIKYSHGDLHPDNMLWEGDDVKAFIDFEAASLREELYDVAFLIGCVGMDDPNELKGAWIKEFLHEYWKQAEPTKLAFELLPELVIATRLRWLLIWQNNPKDKDIADMEKKLIEILIKHADDLRALWLSYCDNFKYSKQSWVMQDAYLVKDISIAKKHTEDIDIFRYEPESVTAAEQFSTDLRLLAIDFGMKDDIRNIIRLIERLRILSEKFESKHILVECSLAMGNSSLDFSKFRLVRGLKHVLTLYEEMLKNDVKEMRTGYAFLLRNMSIQMAELGVLQRSFELIEKQVDFAGKNTDNVEIQGELARTLSNAVTSLLTNKSEKGRIKAYFELLQRLYTRGPGSKKIDVAYKIAQNNLKKSDLSSILQ